MGYMGMRLQGKGVCAVHGRETLELSHPSTPDTFRAIRGRACASLLTLQGGRVCGVYGCAPSG